LVVIVGCDGGGDAFGKVCWYHARVETGTIGCHSGNRETLIYAPCVSRVYELKSPNIE